MITDKKTIYTIGHSTRTYASFLSLLKEQKIEILADIRAFPGSTRFPQFNKETLEAALMADHISYQHLKLLGGRKKPNQNSLNTVWRNASFRAYADYMETQPFCEGIRELETLASGQRTAYMCSEAVWWSCHRALVSDYLKVKGWTVIHILSEGKEQEHPFTKAARITDKGLTYNPAGTSGTSAPELFDE